MKTLDDMLSRHLLIREQQADLTQPPGVGYRTRMRALACGAPLAVALAALAWAGVPPPIRRHAVWRGPDARRRHVGG